MFEDLNNGTSILFVFHSNPCNQTEAAKENSLVLFKHLKISTYTILLHRVSDKDGCRAVVKTFLRYWTKLFKKKANEVICHIFKQDHLTFSHFRNNKFFYNYKSNKIKYKCYLSHYVIAAVPGCDKARGYGKSDTNIPD